MRLVVTQSFQLLMYAIVNLENALPDVYLKIGQCFEIEDTARKNLARYKKPNSNTGRNNAVLQEILLLQRHLIEMQSSTDDKAECMRPNDIKDLIAENFEKFQAAILFKVNRIAEFTKKHFELEEKEIFSKMTNARIEFMESFGAFEKELLVYLQELAHNFEVRVRQMEVESAERMGSSALGVENNVRIIMQNVQSNVFKLINQVTKNLTLSLDRAVALRSRNDLLHTLDQISAVQNELNNEQKELNSKKMLVREYFKQIEKATLELEQNIGGDITGEKTVRGQQWANYGEITNFSAQMNRVEVQVNSPEKLKKNIEMEQDFVKDLESFEIKGETNVDEENLDPASYWRNVGWDIEKTRGDEAIWNAVRCEIFGDCVKPDWISPDLAFAYMQDTYKNKDYGILPEGDKIG